MNSENAEDLYSFSEDEIRNAAFKVSIKPARLAGHVLFIVMSVVIFLLMAGPLTGLKYLGLEKEVNLMEWFMIFIFFLGLVFFCMNVGKEAVISGKGIVLRNWFIFNEAINVSDVEKCEVITGLTSHGRYHTEHFSKAVIYYGGGNRFSVTDNIYRGWDDLVRYMELNRKTEYIDGRSKISRMLDDLSGKMGK